MRAGDPPELPVSRRARVLRVGLVLLCDALLAAAGVVMIRNYFNRPIVVVGPSASPRAPVPVAAPVPVPVPVPIPPHEVRPQAPAPSRPHEPARPPPRPHPHGAPAPAAAPDAALGAPAPEPATADAALPAAPATPDAALPEAAPDAEPEAEPEPVAEPGPDAPPEAEAQPDAAPPLPSPPSPPPDAAPTPARVSVQEVTRGIRAVVERHRDLIEDCFRRAVRASPAGAPVAGRLYVHLRILPSGDAEDVRVVQNQTGSEDLGVCIVSLMQTWKYPVPGTRPMDVVWPFTFQGR